jgi:hypothetical protein
MLLAESPEVSSRGKEGPRTASPTISGLSIVLFDPLSEKVFE